MNYKKIFGLVGVLVIGAVITINVSIGSQYSKKLSSITLSNIEALTIEQPNVDDCKYDPNMDCEALHPIDPNKDEYRENARW
jgi:hypothetical protein